ncbi:hypothetical protein ACWERA_33920, partial [Streptomyces mirabilis]
MDRTPQRHAESLLNALDPLPFPQRMRELALRVGELVPLRPVLEELESRGPQVSANAYGPPVPMRSRSAVTLTGVR